MSAAKGGTLIVAASIGAVEALKDQLGVCRWNYALRLMQQRAKTSVQSYYHTHIVDPATSSSSSFSSSSSSTTTAGIFGNMKMVREGQKINRTEKSLKKVMDLSCWGPSTVRF